MKSSTTAVDKEGNSYNQNNGQVVASFERFQCEECPYKSARKPRMNKKTCRKTLSVRSKERAIKQRLRKTEEFKKLCKYLQSLDKCALEITPA